MDKKNQEQIQEQTNHDQFNSITRKVTPENQNQTHNSKYEESPIKPFVNGIKMNIAPVKNTIDILLRKLRFR